MKREDVGKIKKNAIYNNRFHEESLNKLVQFCGRESDIII